MGRNRFEEQAEQVIADAIADHQHSDPNCIDCREERSPTDEELHHLGLVNRIEHLEAQQDELWLYTRELMIKELKRNLQALERDQAGG